MHAEVAQLVEHATENCGVPSSILGLGTDRGALAPGERKWLSGRASPCQGEGRGFKSRLPLQHHTSRIRFHVTHRGDVAKWLRQGSAKPRSSVQVRPSPPECNVGMMSHPPLPRRGMCVSGAGLDPSTGPPFPHGPTSACCLRRHAPVGSAAGGWPPIGERAQGLQLCSAEGMLPAHRCPVAARVRGTLQHAALGVSANLLCVAHNLGPVIEHVHSVPHAA